MNEPPARPLHVARWGCRHPGLGAAGGLGCSPLPPAWLQEACGRGGGVHIRQPYAGGLQCSTGACPCLRSAHWLTAPTPLAPLRARLQFSANEDFDVYPRDVVRAWDALQMLGP